MSAIVVDEVAVEALADSLHISEATARAALLLDEAAPGWMDNVDLDSLDMSSLTRCVLGQQLGAHPFFAGCLDYEEALDRLGDLLTYAPDIDNGYIYNFCRADMDYVTLINARRMLLSAPPMTDAEDEEFRDQYERRLSGE